MDITRYLTRDALGGESTGNPESRLVDVIKALNEVKSTYKSPPQLPKGESSEHQNDSG